ncbi:hypothetical protein EMCRGX_G005182 [Ephydatia muelleri]
MLGCCSCLVTTDIFFPGWRLSRLLLTIQLAIPLLLLKQNDVSDDMETNWGVSLSMAVKAKLYSASDIMKAVGIDEKSQFNHGFGDVLSDLQISLFKPNMTPPPHPSNPFSCL